MGYSERKAKSMKKRILLALLFSALLGWQDTAAQEIRREGERVEAQKLPDTRGVESQRRDTLDRAPKYVVPGQIRVFEDRRIAALDSLKIVYPSSIRGYRLQLFFGDRDEARKKRVEFTKRYPHIPTYISYLAPNFRLRVGDFRTRLQAEKLKHTLGHEYPGSYIVKDQIELPALRPPDGLAEEE